MVLEGVQAVFFDAVGTLIHPEPPAAAVYAQVGRRFGSHISTSAIRERFAAALAREEMLDRQRGLRTSEDRERQRWQRIVATVLDDVDDATPCFQELHRHFGLPAAWRVHAEGALVVEELSRRGYLVGLASNYDHRLRSVVAGLTELRSISHLVISSEVGWRKPAPEFFAALGRATGLPAPRILHVGDDPDNDYEGARRAGLRAVLFDPRDNHGTGIEKIRRFGEILAGG
jgi:putative hydrolase of the HAD superfamily